MRITKIISALAVTAFMVPLGACGSAARGYPAPSAAALAARMHADGMPIEHLSVPSYKLDRRQFRWHMGR